MILLTNQADNFRRFLFRHVRSFATLGLQRIYYPPTENLVIFVHWVFQVDVLTPISGRKFFMSDRAHTLLNTTSDITPVLDKNLIPRLLL